MSSQTTLNESDSPESDELLASLADKTEHVAVLDCLAKCRSLERRLRAAEQRAEFAEKLNAWLKEHEIADGDWQAIVDLAIRCESAEARLKPEALRAVLTRAGIQHSVGTLDDIIRAITGGTKNA